MAQYDDPVDVHDVYQDYWADYPSSEDKTKASACAGDCFHTPAVKKQTVCDISVRRQNRRFHRSRSVW
jgi:hypothetical protein